MHSYEQEISLELQTWQKRMLKSPSIMDGLSKKIQDKMNTLIPEKVHKGITIAIKQMVRAVLFGSMHTSAQNVENIGIEETEKKVQERIRFYRTAAAAEGGATGAGGFLLSVADFPILLALKLKMLFDIASLYGYDVNDYKERLYILHIFQLAFSSQGHKRDVYLQMEHWDLQQTKLPDDVNAFDWRRFQQEYRDYIDLAKLAQLVPGIGAVVGVVVNYRLVRRLGITAMNAYRMRKLKPHQIANSFNGR